ncbi:hypothetical protein LTS18_014433, partial [Coniosporium uncinatum]
MATPRRSTRVASRETTPAAPSIAGSDGGRSIRSRRRTGIADAVASTSGGYGTKPRTNRANEIQAQRQVGFGSALDVARHVQQDVIEEGLEQVDVEAVNVTQVDISRSFGEPREPGAVPRVGVSLRQAAMAAGPSRLQHNGLDDYLEDQVNRQHHDHEFHLTDQERMQVRADRRVPEVKLTADEKRRIVNEREHRQVESMSSALPINGWRGLGIYHQRFTTALYTVGGFIYGIFCNAFDWFVAKLRAILGWLRNHPRTFLMVIGFSFYLYCAIAAFGYRYLTLPAGHPSAACLFAPNTLTAHYTDIAKSHAAHWLGMDTSKERTER